jgi:protein-disulfide isomerase
VVTDEPQQNIPGNLNASPEEPELPETGSPGTPAPVIVKRADWMGFLTPAAVVLGSIVIAAAVWSWGGSDSGPKGLTRADLDAALAPILQSQAQIASANTSNASGASSNQMGTLDATFKGYAKQVGVDETKFSACMRKPETVQLLNTQLQRGVQLGVNGTPTFFINNKMLVGAQPPQVFDELIAAELKGSPTTLDGYSDNIKQLAAQGQFKIVSGKVDVSDAMIDGDRNARVLIAEFSDFQCPFCKRWGDENLKAIRAKLGKDVALAFLHFPIVQIHPNAANAGAAAICAGEQGKFWQMHDLLFNRQTEWQGLK